MLEKYGSLSDCYTHVAQKVDRETLKGMFSGEVGMGEIAKLKDLMEKIVITNEQFSKDWRINRLERSLRTTEDVVIDVIGAQKYRERLEEEKAKLAKALEDKLA